MSVITKIGLIVIFCLSVIFSLFLSFGPERHFAERKNLETIKGIVTYVSCDGKHKDRISSIQINNSKFYEIPVSYELPFCADVRKEWLGNVGMLNIFKDRGNVDVYELYISGVMIYDISWYKNEREFEDKQVIAFPYIIIGFAIIIYIIKRRKRCIH